MRENRREWPSALGQDALPWEPVSGRNPQNYTERGPAAVPMSGEITGPLGRAVDDLPPQYADVIRMTYGERLSAPEIAELTGLAVGTVRKYRVRGLRLLRELSPIQERPYLEDQMRYSRGTVENLLPCALDPTWTGEPPKQDGAKNHNKAPNEGGDGLVMVLDIRRAISALPMWVGAALAHKGSDGTKDDAVEAVLDFLNGWN